jgi:hypothetical protein
MVDSLVVVPSIGDEMESVGAVASFRTVLVIVEEFPAASVATNVMVLIPSTSENCVLNEPAPPIVTGIPFMVRVTAVESWTEPATAIVACLVITPFTGFVTVRVGGVSSRITVRVTVVLLEPASVAETVMTLFPSAKATLVENELPEPTLTDIPLTFTVTVVESLVVPATLIDV